MHNYHFMLVPNFESNSESKIKKYYNMDMKKPKYIYNK